MNSCDSITYKYFDQDKISKVKYFSLPVEDDYAFRKLNRELAQLKGFPPRVEYRINELAKK